MEGKVTVSNYYKFLALLLQLFDFSILSLSQLFKDAPVYQKIYLKKCNLFHH